MISLFDARFSMFLIFDVLGLCLCSFLLKKFIKKFPNKLIPLTNVIVSLITTLIYLDFHFDNHAPIFFRVVMGILDGLAAVGLHQFIKKTYQYFIINWKIKNFKKDKRKIIS